jgi:hypothetical protein
MLRTFYTLFRTLKVVFLLRLGQELSLKSVTKDTDIVKSNLPRQFEEHPAIIN